MDYRNIIGLGSLVLIISISKKRILENVTGKPCKHCIECDLFFDPLPLEQDNHATHYTLFLPLKAEEFDPWLDRIRNREEDVWGTIWDEDRISGEPFCPSVFQIEVLD